MPKAAPGAAPNNGMPGWGNPGVTDYYPQLEAAITPGISMVNTPLTQSGILEKICLEMLGTVVSQAQVVVSSVDTLKTGIAGSELTQDVFYPWDIYNQISISLAGNVIPFRLSGIALALLNMIEYPDRTVTADATPLDPMNPPAVSTLYGFPPTTPTGRTPTYFPSAANNLRLWLDIPVMMPMMGVPGGGLGHYFLQNPRVNHILQTAWNIYANTQSGSTIPANQLVLSNATGNGSAPYFATGGGMNSVTPYTSVAAAVLTNQLMNIWKWQYNVPSNISQFPPAGFLRFCNEYIQPLSGTSFVYQFEQSGLLMRTIAHFVDGGTTSIDTNNLTTSYPNGGLAYTAGSAGVQEIWLGYSGNKIIDDYSHDLNVQRQSRLYGRRLPVGVYTIDNYTATRSFRDVKNTGAIANFKICATLGGAPEANSYCRIITDKLLTQKVY